MFAFLRTWVEDDLFLMLSLAVYTLRTRKKKEGLPPDFLWSLLAPAHLMRLSLRKAAHAAVGEYHVAGNPGLAPAMPKPH
jgi:DNA-directed RNA polymerase